MNWQEQLYEYETNRDWDKAVDWMNQTLVSSPDDVWAYIHAIYLFHHVLLETDYSDEKQADLEVALQRYFKVSCGKFLDNAEYLFFVGKILHIAEWYFGLEDNVLAIRFQEKAMKLEHGNLLYEWGYRLSCPGDQVVDYFAHQLITNEKSTILWLESKGFPGAYVLEHLRMGNERYVKQKT